MGERCFGVVSSNLAGVRDVLLFLPDDRVVLVDPDLTDEQLAERFGLAYVIRPPALEFCSAAYVDGPLEGELGYAMNELGSHVAFALPYGLDSRRGSYEVVRLADGQRPAELRFSGYADE
ncbi:MAG TPA: hypothetical protein VF163_13030 [Micromonosporaceae bacterium]